MTADDSRFTSALGDVLLREAPHVLGLMDRERDSRTAGCMDRTFWAWKFTDFPGSRFQEGLCYLAFLHSESPDTSPFRGDPALLEWIVSGLDFWTRAQHRDGSFDEAYPLERSLAATAFTSFYIAEAIAMLGDALPAATLAGVRASLERAGGWLCRNDETHGFLSNHLAAAAAALYHIFRLTGDDRFEKRSRYFRDRILGRQSAEGWYDEYGGADPGYQTHGSFYLARLWQMSGDDALATSLDRSMTFLAEFVHADGSIGGEYTSRNTQTYYPAAFEVFAPRSGAAAWIAQRMRPVVLGAEAAGLRAVDAYNYFPMLNNLVFAYRAATSGSARAQPRGPAGAEGLAWFPGAGIARVRRERYDAYVGAAKGGVIKAWDRRTGRLVLSDCGWVARTKDGRMAATQYQDPHRPLRVEDARIEVDGQLFLAARPVMSPLRFLAFRIFTLTVGRWPAVGRWLKRELVRVLIYRKRAVPVAFRRVIDFDEDRITIRDEFRGEAGRRLKTLERRALFTTIHMGSSRYFVLNDLAAARPPAAAEAEAWSIDPARVSEGADRVRTLRFD